MLSFILIGAAIVGFLAIILTGYIKAPPDVAYIISGFRKEPRILIGQAGIKIPFLERKDTLLLKQISIDIKTNGYVPTLDFIGVDIDAVAKVRVNTEADGIKLAMKNFLNMKEAEIIKALTDSLQGNMREIIGTVSLRELNTDRKKFGDEVQEKAQKDMNALGIQIISCNIQRMDDEQNLITSLGQENMSQIQKSASIAKAQAQRDIAIEEAKAKQLANDAKIAADTEIAIKQNEFAIKQAELKKQSDMKQAEADAAYEIQKEEQRKIIEVTKANADIARQEREVELKAKEALVTEQALDAEVRKKADAEKYRRQQEAEAELIERQRQAEAELFEEQKKADAAKAKAEAEAYAKKQQAEAIKALGQAEADAIKAKGLAEAEAIDKKAEAMKKYGQAAMMEMVVGILPEVAKAIAEPMASVDKISIIDGGSGAGANSMYGYVTGGMQKVIESVKETTGLDLVEVMKADTYDAKVNHNINIKGDVAPSVNVTIPTNQEVK